MIGESTKLAELLKFARGEIGKSIACLAKQISIGNGLVRAWEDGICFPLEENLKAISVIYQIDFEILENAFHISKKEREKEKLARRAIRKH